MPTRAARSSRWVEVGPASSNPLGSAALALAVVAAIAALGPLLGLIRARARREPVAVLVPHDRDRCVFCTAMAAEGRR